MPGHSCLDAQCCSVCSGPVSHWPLRSASSRTLGPEQRCLLLATAPIGPRIAQVRGVQAPVLNTQARNSSASAYSDLLNGKVLP